MVISSDIVVISVPAKAVSKLGDVVGRLIEYSKTHEVTLIVTADHGNCERMGTPEIPIQHIHNTLYHAGLFELEIALEPHIMESDLTAIAPTVLSLMWIEKPQASWAEYLLSNIYYF
jgi:2,3-bisphosphoglycerate-independent phosphoglycerate mutase